MLNLIEIFTIIFTHFIGDFVFQTDWQAKNKSKSNFALTSHVKTYSSFWLLPIGILLYIGPFNLYGTIFFSLIFALVTFICHWITDYYTSRLNSKLWAKGDVHNFFVSVGWDQCMHYVQLFLTYYFIKTL